MMKQRKSRRAEHGSRRGMLLALLLAGLTLLTACRTEGETLPGADGDVADEPAAAEPADQIGLAARLDASFNPLFTDNKYNYELAGLLHEPLVALSESFTPELRLAESAMWDGLTLRLTLRSGLRFSDGSALTAEDVVGTLEQVRANASCNYYERLKNVAEISALGDNVVSITLREPDGLFLSMLEIPILKKGSSVTRPIGCGAYRFAQQEGETLLLPNEYWAFGSDFAVKKVTLVHTDNNDDLVDNLSAGKIDMLLLTASDFGKISITGSYSYKSIVTNEFVYMGVNAGSSVWGEAGMRRALSVMLDRGELLEDVIQKNGFVSLSPVQPSWYLFDSTAVSSGTKDGTSDELLTALGYEKDADGIYAKDGRQLTARIIVNTAGYTKLSLADAIAAQLQKAGVLATVEKLDSAAFSSALSGRNFDFYMAEVRLTPNMNLAPLIASGGSLNYGRYSNAEMDEALSALCTAAAGAEQRAAARALIALADREMPVIPLYFNTASLVSRRALGFSTTPRPGNAYYGLAGGYQS